jgi:hypothetical protein
MVKVPFGISAPTKLLQSSKTTRHPAEHTVVTQVGQRGKFRARTVNSGSDQPDNLAEMVRTTRQRINFFMNKFRRPGFIQYNGGIKITIRSAKSSKTDVLFGRQTLKPVCFSLSSVSPWQSPAPHTMRAPRSARYTPSKTSAVLNNKCRVICSESSAVASRITSMGCR